MMNGQKTARLMKRAAELHPTVMSWLNTFSENQRKELMQRFLTESPLMQYIDSLAHNPQTKARIERNPNLQNAIQALTYYTL